MILKQILKINRLGQWAVRWIVKWLNYEVQRVTVSDMSPATGQSAVVYPKF